MAQLDWSSAEVRDGTLAVALDGERSDAWTASFERTATLLNHGNWSDVKLGKHKVRIEPVVAGEEERVRHFLESVVLQANTDAGFDAEAGQEEPVAEQDEAREQGEDEVRADEQMTERFRSFAEAGDAA